MGLTKTVAVIGSGVAGLTAAIGCAEAGDLAILVSPLPAERSQSVMATGGINAVSEDDPEDSVALHAEETLAAGRGLGGEAAVSALCADAPAILRFLEDCGVVFTRDSSGKVARRAFGGQSRKRTAYSGASTGKHIVAGLSQKAREWECAGRIRRMTGYRFCSALLKDGVCYGALLRSEKDGTLVPLYADALVIASGGQNALFGKTTGSSLSDGFAAGRLFLQGAALKNPEFIQYHPTSVETPQKRMLITEAARGEGGRLFVKDGEKPVYFMEDRFGERGNLMPRDTVVRMMEEQKKQVYLDLSFLPREVILKKLFEVYDLCKTYLGIDVTKESIPVAPSVHFFMGGLAVDSRHRTSIKNVYAIGECASMYHGANRLGGNSLLAAIHGARVCVEDLKTLGKNETTADFSEEIAAVREELSAASERSGDLTYPAFLAELSSVMNGSLGIVREEERLAEGLRRIDRMIADLPRVNAATAKQSSDLFALPGMLALARATLLAASARKETRGSHIRKDYPEMSDAFAACTVVTCRDGAYEITYRKEDELCW